jgi:predicted AAA+ superfamily ATPase
MTEKIGSVFSYRSLSEDLQTDDKSIKRWMTALENSYVFFKITPYSKQIKASIKKAPKYYFYDYPRVSNEAARLENFVALALSKEIFYRNEVEGESYSLHYLRDGNQNELDFLITKNKIPLVLIEVKTSDCKVSKTFNVFAPYLEKQNPKLIKVQLVKNLMSEFSNKEGVRVLKLANWLEQMPF